MPHRFLPFDFLFFFRLPPLQFYVHFRFVHPLNFSSFIYILLLLLLLSPFFVSCYFIWLLFRLLLNYTGTPPPVPLHLVPPSRFQCYLQFHCSSLLIPFFFFPVLHSTLLCSFFSPGSACGNFTV